MESDYQDDEFEWRREKAATNTRDHRVSFEEAREIFSDPLRDEWLDDREDYGEERFTSIGLARGQLLVVTYTLRGRRKRLISARKPTREEREVYEEGSW